MPEPSPHVELSDDRPWYSGVTRYQWLVLVIACAGWVFDQYESQVFVVTKDYVLKDIHGVNGELKRWTENLFAIFLLGSTIGGLVCGSLADRYGRRPLLIATILIYSLFSGLTYFVTDLWQLAIVRFLIAMGVGGEWAVAASLVAEVFRLERGHKRRAFFMRPVCSGSGWPRLPEWLSHRNGDMHIWLGFCPLLIVWVRVRVREPEKWQAKSAEAKASTTADAELGSFRVLLTQSPWRRRALLGVALAAVGLGTFWSVIVAGQSLAKEQLLRDGVSEEQATKQSQFAYGFVQTTGGGLGLLAFGPISARFGRRRTFIGFQLLAMAIVPITCFAPQNYQQLLMLLPIFAFLTVAIHAGYAIYFPELFPTSLRATGASFCFNGGRVVAVPVLLLSGWLKGQPGVDLRWAVTGLSSLFLLGIVIVLFLPETNRQELPE